MEQFMNLIDLKRLTTMVVAFLPKLAAALLLFVGFVGLRRYDPAPRSASPPLGACERQACAAEL